MRIQTEQRIKYRNQEEKIAMDVSLVSVGVNLLLSLIKLMAGVIGSSGALISDAIHSASDVFSTLIVMIGVKISGRQSDKAHPYGHERFECVASIILSVTLAITGGFIGIQGFKNIISIGQGMESTIPGKMTLIAAMFSILIKEAQFRYTKRAAEKIDSGALMADAWHHRSDALSSVGSFAGILGARMGFSYMDPAASLIICLFIMGASLEIFTDAVNKMMDTACDEATVEKIRELTLSQEGVLGIDMIKTRMFGNKKYVDIEIRADGCKTLNETHKIAEDVHHIIESNVQGVKHCMVHVNPQQV